MGNTGALAEVTKANETLGAEQLRDRSERALVGRAHKIGLSGSRSAAIQEAFESEVLSEKDTPYALSKSAASFLGHVLPDAKPAELLFRPADVAQIVEALLLARGPAMRPGKVSLNYREGLEALLSPGSSYAKVADEVFHNSTNAAYMSLLQFAKKCRSAFEEGASIEDLIHLSDANYQFEAIEKPVEQVRVEREKNLGKASVVRTPVRRTERTEPRASKAQKPSAHLYGSSTVVVPPARTGVNSPYQYSVDESSTPRATEEDQPLAWQREALCAQTDPEAFFPEKGGSTRDAKKICTTCDVRDACLEYALSNDERFGIWGGLSERERRKLKRKV